LREEVEKIEEEAAEGRRKGVEAKRDRIVVLLWMRLCRPKRGWMR
jgi:hypothetical protein